MRLKVCMRFASVQTLFGDSARNRLLTGVSAVKRAAVVTLGPFGRNVVIEAEKGNHRVTKDGVTVVRSVFLNDRLAEIGAALIRQSSGQTNKYAGDGTTTSAILAATIFEQGQKYVASGHNPIILVRGLKEAQKKVLDYLEEIRTVVEEGDDQLIFAVAKLSANYDDNIADCVYKAIKEVGLQGAVSIEPGGKETQISIQQGTVLTRGLTHEQFADEGKTSQTLFYPMILASTSELRSMKQLLPILERLKQANQALFIIAPDISEEVLSQLLFNKKKGIINVGVITVPGFGTFSEETITDLAILCGCQLDQEISYEALGHAVKVEIGQAETTFYGIRGDEQLIEERKGLISEQLKSGKQAQLLKDRLARLEGKSAIIYVGGHSEIELHESRDKIVDSLNATKNTLKHGVLPGGGAAMLHASKLLDYLDLEDQTLRLGVKLLQQTLLEPTKILCRNSGINEGQIVNALLQEADYNVGFDLRRLCLGSMIDLGVVDSYQTIVQSIIDGVSLGCMLLTTETAIVLNQKYTPTPLNQYKPQIF